MKKTFVVNGVEYDKAVEESNGDIVMTSAKHANIFISTLDDLQTQYGVKTAYGVRMAIMRSDRTRAMAYAEHHR